MDGLLAVNKPQGLTSFKTVLFIRNLLKIKKAGHAGTLDPMAEGVLLVCLGKKCKNISKLADLDKTYEAEITFGIATDSGDSDGKILSKSPVSLRKENIAEILPAFIGEIMQVPPMVSALHHKGKRLYELARKGIIVDRPPRKIKINSIELLDFKEGEYPTAYIKVSCSKGTYIRSLCEDIGKKLGVPAHESKLTRTKIGNFDLSTCYNLLEIKHLFENGKLGEILINDF